MLDECDNEKKEKKMMDGRSFFFHLQRNVF